MKLGSHLFKCVSCGENLSHALAPLCRLCSQSLVECPPLCPSCGSPVCLQPRQVTQCKQPWRDHKHIHSFSAQYLLVGKGYEVLKKWKTTGGVLLDRDIISPSERLSPVWNAFDPQAVVPIPQTFDRAWQMRGGSTDRVASWVSQVTRIPLVRALQLASQSGAKRQAELPMAERLENPIQFEAKPSVLVGLRRILLIDDFMTTGTTLSKAAYALTQAGVHSVHCFCLGIRLGRQTP